MEEVLVILGRIEVTGSVGIGSYGAEAVGTAGVESLGERTKGRVAERNVRSRKEARGDRDLIGEVEPVAQFRGQLDKLVKGDAAQRFVLIAPLMSEDAIDGVDEVARLLDAEVNGRVDASFGAIVIVHEGIADGGHELVTGNDLDELRVLRRFVIEAIRLRFHPYHGEREGRESMGDELAIGRVDEIGERSGELVYAVAAGYVLVLVAEHVPCTALRVVVACPMEVGEDERGVGAQLIGVGLLRVARMSVPQGPVISSVALDGESLATAQQVLDRCLEREVGTQAVVRAVGHTGIGGEVIGAGDGVTLDGRPDER